MSETKQPPLEPVESRRVPLEREVVLEFEHFANFIREYSANVSLGGMFVKTDRPRLPDTVFRFEVRLADDGPLISGLAKVLWVREEAEAEDRPAGMGVRFLELAPEGRGLIEQIVQEHMARGGQPFRLEEAVEAAVGADRPAPPPSPSDSGAPAPSPSDSDEPAPSPGDSGEPPPSPSDSGEPASVPLDKSTVIELPPLEDLLEEARGSKSKLTLDTPPRGWKPGISVARPQTRPQLVGAIAVAAALLAGVVYLVVRMFATTPVVDESETAPPELPRPEASAGAEAEPALEPFRGVREVSWRRVGNRAEVVVRLDGALPEGSWSVDRISDPPRHLLKLMGASRPYPAETIEVGFGGVRQLRTGYHDTGAGNEQHLVVDLVNPRVVLEEAAAEGDTVRLLFRELS